MTSPLEQASDDIDARLSLGQMTTLALLASDEQMPRVVGWHGADAGPLIVRGDGRWQTILPDGRIRTKVSVAK